MDDLTNDVRTKEGIIEKEASFKFVIPSCRTEFENFKMGAVRPILTALFLCLTIHCGIVETASGAAVGFGQKTASGSPELSPDIYTYELGSLGQEPCWFDEVIHYDPATGVLYYVRQNPWSAFDPLGLSQVLVGFVYIIEAPGEKPYVGKATTLKGRLNLRHPHADMMAKKGATVRIAPLRADKPKRGWTRKTLSQAQRLAEQDVLDSQGGKGGFLGTGPTKNRINAMSEKKVAKYIDDYNTTVGKFTTRPGSKFVQKTNSIGGKGASVAGWIGWIGAGASYFQQRGIPKELNVSTSQLERITSWNAAITTTLTARNVSEINNIIVNRATGHVTTLTKPANKNAIAAWSHEHDVYSYNHESGELADVTNNAMRQNEYQNVQDLYTDEEPVPEPKE